MIFLSPRNGKKGKMQGSPLLVRFRGRFRDWFRHRDRLRYRSWFRSRFRDLFRHRRLRFRSRLRDRFRHRDWLRCRSWFRSRFRDWFRYRDRLRIWWGLFTLVRFSTFFVVEVSHIITLPILLI